MQDANGTLYATNGAGRGLHLEWGLGRFVKTVPAARKVGERVTIPDTNLTGTGGSRYHASTTAGGLLKRPVTNLA